MPAFWEHPRLLHDYPYYWFISDPKSKQDKVKFTNLKNLPKILILEFCKRIYMRHIFWSFLFRYANMKRIRLVQCTLDISRLLGSKQWYHDISRSAIYRACHVCHEPKSGSIFQRVVSDIGAFVHLVANSARRQGIYWHLSKFDVALK